MPTYEYSCQKCGHTFDCVQSMTAPAFTICPKELCAQKKWGKGKVKRGVGGGTGLLFKGSGFYITDYRSEGYKTAVKNESAAGKSAAPAATPAASTPAAPASGGANTSKSSPTTSTSPNSTTSKS